MKIVRRFLFFAHFFLVILVLTHINDLFDSNGVISKFINSYSSISYCNRNFGFFAPNVASDLDLKMIAHRKTDSLSYSFPVYSNEMKNRLYSLMGHFGESGIVSMDLFARSFGVYCMNQIPEVNKVHIVVYENQIPTMASYRNGERITKIFFYESTVHAK